MAAIFLANLIEYHREGFKPERDIIVALTTDEELAHSPHNGVKWMLDNERALIDAEFALNEGGGGALRNGRPFRLAVQLAEKVYQTYVLEVTDAGGHSASPRRDNPIYRLSAALTKLAQFDFPPRLNPVTRANFERLAETEAPPMAAAIKALLAGSTDPPRSRRSRPIRPTTRRCAPPASPRCSRPARSRTRCRRPRAPP